MEEDTKQEVKSRQVELLEELVAETKKSGDFTQRYSYVSFCLTILAIMIATMAVIFSLSEMASSILDFAVSAVILGSLISAAFWMMMMRKPGFDED
jgi:hypothetical protein